MRCACGHAPSKRLVVIFVQVHEAPTSVGTELQSFIGVAIKFRPSSMSVHVGPIFLNIVGYAIRFSPEVPIGHIKSVSVISDPLHGLYQFSTKEHFGTLSVSCLFQEGSRIVDDQIVR